MALSFFTAQQAIASSSATGGRAGLTLLGMAIAGHFGYIDFPEGIVILTTLPGIAGLVGLTLIEELTERDEDMQELLEWISYGTKGAAGALAAWSVDMMPEGVPPWIATIGGMVLAGATHHYRMKLHETLRGFGDHWLSPRTYLVWLESGGIMGLVVAIVFAPFLAILILLLFFLLGALWLSARWATERKLRRHPCPACGKRIRNEATLCRYCAEPVAVQKWLGQRRKLKPLVIDAVDSVPLLEVQPETVDTG